jgi:hypothetical protein
MRFVHSKTHHASNACRSRAFPAPAEFHLAAIVQNVKTMSLYLIRTPPEPELA